MISMQDFVGAWRSSSHTKNLDTWLGPAPCTGCQTRLSAWPFPEGFLVTPSDEKKSILCDRHQSRVHREFRRWSRSMTIPEIPKVKSILVDPGHKRHQNGGKRCHDQSDHDCGLLLRTPCFRERLGQRTKLLGTFMNHHGHAGGPSGLQPGVWPRKQGCSHHAPVNIFRDVNEKTESLGPRWRSWSVNGERRVTHCTRRRPRRRRTGQLSNCRGPGHGSGVHLKCTVKSIPPNTEK